MIYTVADEKGTYYFSMHADGELERWRAESFWNKENETIEWINDFKDSEVFWDVGANIGIYSLYAASRHPGLKIYAVEPVLQNYLRLLENIELNHFDSQIFPLNVALSRQCKRDYLSMPDSRVGNSGAQLTGQGQPVLVLTLGVFADWGADHVKIDVDGIEKQILWGASLNFMDKTKSWLIEVNDENSQSEIDVSLRLQGFTTDNRYNSLENHSRNRRGEWPKNVVFTRS